MISSNKATIMVIKLPDVTNFKLTQTSIDNYTGEAAYSFVWDSFGERFSGNTAMFYFEITPEPEIQPFNGKTENGATIALPFNYSGLDAGEYVFNIQAKGRNSKTESSGFAFGFVNGDKLTNPITVTVLDKLEFVSYNRETNKVTITNCESKMEKKCHAYTGKAIKAKVIVTDKGSNKQLKENVDFKVSYSNNTKRGTAKAKIIGIGEYTSSKTITFTIR